MKRTHGAHTAVAAAIAFACGGAVAQDAERGDEPVLESETSVEQSVDIARGDQHSEQHLEDDRLGSDIDDRGELAEEIADEQELADKRQQLERSAETAIEELRAADSDAAMALDEAYGYAVFDTAEGGLIVTGAGGTGVAKVKDRGESTFMHVGGAGIGLGAGGENYKLVFVFSNEETYNDFVDGDWEAGASAQAAAGEEGAASEAITEDVQVYHLTDAGLIAQADIAGMRFWPSEELNDTAVAEAETESGDDHSEADRELH